MKLKCMVHHIAYYVASPIHPDHNVHLLGELCHHSFSALNLILLSFIAVSICP